MAFPPMSPSCLVNAFRSPHFDPFATEEDVHSLLEVCFLLFLFLFLFLFLLWEKFVG